MVESEGCCATGLGRKKLPTFDKISREAERQRGRDRRTSKLGFQRKTPLKTTCFAIADKLLV